MKKGEVRVLVGVSNKEPWKEDFCLEDLEPYAEFQSLEAAQDHAKELEAQYTAEGWHDRIYLLKVEVLEIYNTSPKLPPTKGYEVVIPFSEEHTAEGLAKEISENGYIVLVRKAKPQTDENQECSVFIDGKKFKSKEENQS